MGNGRGPREAPLSDTPAARSFRDVIRQRRMTRAFQPVDLDADVVERILDQARRAPSAGNTASTEFLLLDTPSAVEAYWSITLTDERRAGFPWPGLLDAPVLVIPWVDPQAYVARYDEADKSHTGLGDGIESWPVPYWFVDGGAAAMSLLLSAESEGLGALLFGLFAHEAAVGQRFGVPVGRRAVGTIALGHAAADRVSASAERPRRPLTEVVHRGGW